MYITCTHKFTFTTGDSAGGGGPWRGVDASTCSIGIRGTGAAGCAGLHSEPGLCRCMCQGGMWSQLQGCRTSPGSV